MGAGPRALESVSGPQRPRITALYLCAIHRCIEFSDLPYAVVTLTHIRYGVIDIHIVYSISMLGRITVSAL